MLCSAPESSAVFAPTVAHESSDGFSMYERKFLWACRSVITVRKKRLSQVFASGVVLRRRNAIFSAEPAWHVALCRQVWAQLERNNREIRCSVHRLLSSWYQNSQHAFGLSVEVLSVGVRVLLACESPEASVIKGGTWSSLSVWSLDDVSRLCKLLFYNTVHYVHHLNASSIVSAQGRSSVTLNINCHCLSFIILFCSPHNILQYKTL